MTSPPLRASLRANFGWLLAERGWRVVMGLAVSLLITRHLGPERFGLLSLAFSLHAIFGAVMGLGIDDVLAREMARQPGRAAALVATGFRIKFLGALGSFPLALLTTWVLRPGDWSALALVAMATFALFLLPSDVVELWYQSRERMRPPAVVRQVALGLTALVRVGLVVADAPLWAFAAAVSVEVALIALGFAYLWRRDARFAVAAESGTEPGLEGQAVTRRLLREGFPLLCSGFLVVITMHCDRLLLIQWAGDRAAGIYSAAARMTELLYILPVALGATFLPRLSVLHLSDPEAYAALARKAVIALVGATSGIAVIVTVIAGTALPWLLGEAYRPAANVCTVHIWTLVFVSIVSLRSRLWVVEERTGWILVLSIATAAANLLGNAWLIPRHGPMGAAWAAVIAWGLSALVLPWCAPGPARSMLVWCGLAKSA